jgi:MFS family permease
MSKAQQISEIIEKIGWGKYNLYLFLIIALTCMLIFYGAALGSITAKEAAKEWGMSKFAMSQLGTAQLGGLFIGSFMWGYIANHYGRILVLKICLVISIVTYLVYTFSVDYYMAISIIFLQGIGFAGMLSTAPPTYYECCPPKKAWTMVLVSWSLCFGLILGNFIAFLTVIAGDAGVGRWRWVSGVGCVLSILALIGSHWLLESPRYLDLKGQGAKAREVLKEIASWNKAYDSPQMETPIITYNSNIQEDEELEIEELIKPAEKVEFKELFCIHHIKKSTALAAVISI